MHCPNLTELPSPPSHKTGWPWTAESPKLSDTASDGSPWPRISIVMPSYNQGPYIEESIRSVLLQGYPDLEFFIFDGGSTDGSVEIIRKYQPWLAYWESEPNRGQSHGINKGLARSTGRLFNWQNSDDVLLPESLATTAAAMIQYPDSSAIHGYAIVIDSQSNILYHNNQNRFLKNGRPIDLNWSISHLKCACQPGSLMDRALAVELGMVDENLQYAMDLDLSLRLALVKPQIYIDSPVVYFRLHPESKSCSMTKERARDRLVIAKKLFAKKDLPSEIQKLKTAAFASGNLFAARNYFRAKMYGYALGYSLKYMVYNPRECIKFGLWHIIRRLPFG